MSRGPIVLVVVLAVAAATIFGWLALRDRITAQGEEAARACVEGPSTLSVVASPDIAEAVREIAADWDATEPVVRDRCVTTDVVAGTEPLDGTALWIPASSAVASRVTADAGRTQGPPRGFASSPVVLAVAPALADVLGRAGVEWGDLPALTSRPGALDELGAPGWGALRPALPTVDTETTTAALGAVAAAVGSPAQDPTGAVAPAVTAEQAASAPVRDAVSRLSIAASAVADAPADTAAALAIIANAPDPAAAAIHAVPVSEQQAVAAESDGMSIAVFRPAGPTPVVDRPAVLLTGVDDSQSLAAAELLEFARAPERAGIVTAAGFRVLDAEGTPRAAPSTPDGTSLPDIEAPLPPLPDDAASVLQDTLAAPVRPSASTVLLDVSGSMASVDAGDTRLANVTDALQEAIGRVPATSSVGLWVYSRALVGDTPYRVVSELAPLSDDRRAGIAAELGTLTPATATSTYASVVQAYQSAVASWNPDGPNSLVLVTDGPDDDTSLTSATFLDTIAAASDPARPVRIDVVSLAENSDIDTLRSLAAQTGGQMIETTSADPGLPGLLERSMAPA